MRQRAATACTADWSESREDWGDSMPVRSNAPLFQAQKCCTRTIRGLMAADKWMTWLAESA